MFTARKRFGAIALAAIVAVGAAPALSACSAESIVKNVTGGKVDVGGNSLPDGFPSSVPVYKGKIITAVGVGSGDKKVFNVSVQLPSQDAAKDIASELTNAGFTGGLDVSGDGSTSIATFSNATYTVLVAVAKSGSNWVANYTVTPVKDTTSTPGS
jgi:hypothetical protein